MTNSRVLAALFLCATAAFLCSCVPQALNVTRASTSQGTFKFTNNEGEKANDLTVVFDQPVDIVDAGPFESYDSLDEGETSYTFRDGEVLHQSSTKIKVRAKKGGTGRINVTRWQWSKNGQPLGSPHGGNPD